ncbi:MAG: Trk system potassium transporter TrkA, partial [Oscillospiraceae bacterium]|nr:Trk system potassium transporter TrkA [Oscillospiraceae bacterium]
EGMIDTIVSATSVTTELIVQYVRAMESASGVKVKTLHRLVGGAVEALEFSITEDVPFIDIPLRELGPRIKDNVLLAGIVRRSGEIIIPSGKDSFQLGDDVIVVTTTPNLQDICDIIK